MAVWDERAVTTGEKRDYGRTRGDKTERGSCPSVGIVGETQGRGTDAESREGEGAGRRRSGKAVGAPWPDGLAGPKGAQRGPTLRPFVRVAMGGNRKYGEDGDSGRRGGIWGTSRHHGEQDGPRESDVIAGK